MGVTLDVPPGVLAAAKKEWADAVDELDAAWRSLHRTSTGSLSREVAAAVETFRETWVDDLKGARKEADGFVEAFEGVDVDFVLTDTAEAEAIRALLPWQYRDATIRDR